MKRILSVVVVGLILSMYLLSFGVFAAAFDINIIHTTDLNGNIYKNEEKGTVGYGNVLSVRDHIGNAMIVDCGNFLGSVSQKNTTLNGEIIYAMNKVGYKYASLGYNELRYTKAELDDILMNADFEIISSNLKTGETYPYTQYKAEMINGVKVGIFAVTDAQSTEDFSVEDVEAVSTNMVRQLRAGGTKVIICILNTKNPDLAEKISTQNPDITMILEGGTEEFKPQGKVFGRTLVVNPGSNGNAVGVSAVKINGAVLQSFQTANYNLSNIKDVYPDTNSLEEEMKSAQGKIDTENSNVVCILSEEIPYEEEKSGIETTVLGNFAADTIRDITGADFAIVNAANLKVPLPKEVTYKNLNELFYNNSEIVVKEISGKNFLKIIELGINKIKTDENGKIDVENSKSEKFLEVSGIQVEYNPAYRPGKRVVVAKTKKGNKITTFTNKTYTVAGSPEVLDRYTEYFKDGGEAQKFENSIQLMKEHYAKNKNISVDKEERIRKTENKKSVMWIVWLILGSFMAVALVAYIVARAVMILNRE